MYSGGESSTKIKPIRGTVNKAIAYIIDPKKLMMNYWVPRSLVQPVMLPQRNLSGHEILPPNRVRKFQLYLQDT